MKTAEEWRLELLAIWPSENYNANIDDIIRAIQADAQPTAGCDRTLPELPEGIRLLELGFYPADGWVCRLFSDITKEASGWFRAPTPRKVVLNAIASIKKGE